MNNALFISARRERTNIAANGEFEIRSSSISDGKMRAFNFIKEHFYRSRSAPIFFAHLSAIHGTINSAFPPDEADELSRPRYRRPGEREKEIWKLTFDKSIFQKSFTLPHRSFCSSCLRENVVVKGRKLKGDETFRWQYNNEISYFI